MFPTFISILDIQSWWEVPSIAHFCSLFRTAFNLLDFDIEDLEEALLTDGTEEPSWLQELIVRLLSGCLQNNDISTFNYQMFLRRLFRQKCQEHDRYNPFNTDIDFQNLPLRTKVDILHALCDFRLDAEDVIDQLKNLEADSLRVEPLGYDANDSAYWYFYGTRLYREDFTSKSKKQSVWQVICFTEDDWFQLAKKLKQSSSKIERQLHRTLSENFLPELPRLFKEKERLARKRLLENQPRRTSNRLKKTDEPNLDEEEKRRKRKELEVKRQEAYDKDKEERNEMAGNKGKKQRGRIRKLSEGSDSDFGSKTKRQKKGEKAESAPKKTTVGRQTNNSLSAATGQIVIQSVSQVKKKKKTQTFRQTDEDLQTGLHKILDYVKNHEDAWPFADPVDEDYAPNYYSVIRKPMDLQRMEERLEAGSYKNYSKFRDDFQLIVDNCRLYNGVENEYTEMVDNLLKVFERATEKYLDQITSSEAESEEEKPSKGKKKKEEKEKKHRKPALAAQTDKKRHRSVSEESVLSNNSLKDKDKKKPEKSKEKKLEKAKKDQKKPEPKKRKKSRSPSLKRQKSESPPPSDSCPSSPESWKKRSETSKSKKIKELFEDEVIKPKDKHNKLRETIEKLKAKSEISNKVSTREYDFIDTEKHKKRKEGKKEKEKEKEKDKKVEEKKNKHIKKEEDDKKGKKEKTNSSTNKDPASIEALTLATEQTLKDINKWLDDTPKFSEFSSASNSPSYAGLDEYDFAKIEEKKKEKIKKDGKEIKRRPFRDPAKFLKQRREVQRTIDRLQPGKGKGNLITNVSTKVEEVFPLGPLSKTKDTKNSLIVKTDNNAPKLSLGSVLDSFGKHKFVDDQKKDEKESKPEVVPFKDSNIIEEKKEVEEKEHEEEEEPGGATPNLSAWFKAFGAPKIQAPVKKDSKADKENEEKKEEVKKVPVCEPSPNQEVQVRQRRLSTGSSMSERSSFSQDMDSPRVGIDERLGAYPAPYPSPLHRSPSGASPVMASPRPDVSPKNAYPPFNGQMRVGFYQDTVSNKSSPDKSCSPRDNPQSPYPQYSEHVYTPNTTQNPGYSYPGSPYYAHSGSYPSTNSSYPERYYDTNKSLTEQYQKSSTQYNSPGQYSASSPAAQSPAEFEEQKTVEKTASPVFPVKKRAYPEVEPERFPESKEEKQEPKKPFVELKPANPQNQPHVQSNLDLRYNSNYNPPYSENNYSLNIPRGASTSAPQEKLDMSKYTNMGYTGPEVNFRGLQQFHRTELDYRAQQQAQQGQQDSAQRYSNQIAMSAQSYQERPIQAQSSFGNVEEPLGLRSNLSNLSHIVERFGEGERMMMQGSGGFYGDKPLGAPHMFNKVATSTPMQTMFSQGNVGMQSFNQGMVPSSGASSMYNRSIDLGAEKQQEKKKKRKSKGGQEQPQQQVNSQGFQSYAGLKNQGMEPGAIALKSANVVPGSAFNLCPTPSGLGISGGLYEKDAYQFLDEYRNAPNYYMAAAAAAHHRATPDGAEKQARAAHQASAPQGAGYPYLGAAPVRPTYPFIPGTQPQLMDTGAPLYQHYLQAGVLNQGLLGPGAYPPSYHPALSIRQPYDSMTRPSWL